MFDIEKYTIVKSMQDGKMDVKTDVTNAYDTVIKDITDELLKNDEFRKTHEWITKETLLESKVGSKYFREMVMLAGFHPELAPRFFDEVMDGKLVKE